MATGIIPTNVHTGDLPPRDPAHLDDEIKEAHFVITSDRSVRPSDGLTIDHCRQVHVFAYIGRGRGRGGAGRGGEGRGGVGGGEGSGHCTTPHARSWY